MLRKEFRISRQKDFDSFLGKSFYNKRGRIAVGYFIVLKAFLNDRANSRFGFIVSNKVDNRATARNRIKRCLRQEAFSLISGLRGSWDCLIIAKPRIKDKNKEEISAELAGLFKKAGL